MCGRRTAILTSQTLFGLHLLTRKHTFALWDLSLCTKIGIKSTKYHAVIRSLISWIIRRGSALSALWPPVTPTSRVVWLAFGLLFDIFVSLIVKLYLWLVLQRLRLLQTDTVHSHHTKTDRTFFAFLYTSLLHPLPSKKTRPPGRTPHPVLQFHYLQLSFLTIIQKVSTWLWTIHCQYAVPSWPRSKTTRLQSSSSYLYSFRTALNSKLRNLI